MSHKALEERGETLTIAGCGQTLPVENWPSLRLNHDFRRALYRIWLETKYFFILNSVKDFEKILNELKSLEIPKFKVAKEDYIRRTEFVRDK